MILYAVINGLLDDIPVGKIRAFETEFYRHMDVNHPETGKAIDKTKELTSETEEALKKAIGEFKKSFIV
jgi:F-type H+-transporting ATPase subunit alpha